MKINLFDGSNAYVGYAVINEKTGHCDLHDPFDHLIASPKDAITVKEAVRILIASKMLGVTI